MRERVSVCVRERELEQERERERKRERERERERKWEVGKNQIGMEEIATNIYEGRLRVLI